MRFFFTNYVGRAGIGILLSLVSLATNANQNEVYELVLLLDNDKLNVDSPSTVTDLVNARQDKALMQKLLYPMKARKLIANYQLATKNSNSTKGGSAILNRYIILSYPNRKALKKAKIAIKNNPATIWVGENHKLEWSFVPTDPLYANTGIPLTYQWGMHALDMEAVWEYSKGHSYIAVLDSGIEVNHPDLQDNYRGQLSRNFDCEDGADCLAGNVDEVNKSTVGFANYIYPKGHGTHVAGIIGASSNNQIGVAGACMNCSLMVGVIANVDGRPDMAHLARGIVWMTDTGAQVINVSLGGTTDYCSNPNHPVCAAIAYAEKRDVMIVAAAGNNSGGIDFPASDPRVIAVGAINAQGTTPTNWPNGGPSAGPEMDFVAPGNNIISTFYSNGIWNDKTGELNCYDMNHDPVGYGGCSGTSMSAPHISGISGIIRSVNPLLTKEEIKSVLIKHSSQATSKDDAHGYGKPDVLQSIKEVLGVSEGNQVSNRLTPLFSLYSIKGQDYFYTTTPQMAMAAIYGAMQPQPSGGTVTWYSLGAATPGYNSFPQPGFWWTEKPKANVYVLTTPNNPISEGGELAPLYRLSRQRANGSNTLNVDHTYTTDRAEIAAYKNDRYNLDGIEGYIFPKNEPQPNGTVKLYRKYNPARDDHAIFPESMLSYMASQGYTVNSGSEWIGYVFPNQDSDGDGLIDGYELMLRTDIHNSDSDFDGISDGIEVISYPNSDPMLP